MRQRRNRIETPAGRERVSRLALAMTILVTCAAAVATRDSRGTPALPEFTARARHLMGTRLLVMVPGDAEARIFEEVFSEVARLEGILSNWRIDSELSRVNRDAGAGPVPCSADLFRSVEAAVFWAERTGGAFDPSVEPIVHALGLIGEAVDAPFTGAVAQGSAVRPTPRGEWTARASESVASRAGGGAPPVGWPGIRLDRARRTIAFASTGMGIDLGGIGKGIALDAAARVLRRHGHRAALLDFGGQVLALGAPPGQEGWVIGVADPDDRESVSLEVIVRDLSLSTSGAVERPGPRGEGHIIDPATGRPADFAGAVTVAASDATQADALSTALFVMGEETGLRWARRRDTAALFSRRHDDGTIGLTWSEAFSRRVRRVDRGSTEGSPPPGGDVHDPGLEDP